MSRESRRRDARGAGQSARSNAASEAPVSRGRTGPKQFLKEVRGELRKVAWPNRKEVASYTVVVLVTTLVLVMVVWGMDEVIRRAVINTLG